MKIRDLLWSNCEYANDTICQNFQSEYLDRPPWQNERMQRERGFKRKRESGAKGKRTGTREREQYRV